MKWLDKYILRTKIFVRYLVAIVGIVLLAVSCIVMIAVQNMLDKKYEQEIEVLDSKLGSVAEDINGQINDMRRLVMKLSFERQNFLFYPKAAK